jgi:hypothetical protein
MNTITPSSAALAQNGSYFWKRQIFPVDVAADGGAAEAEALHAVFERLGRELRLHPQRRRFQ